VLVLQPGTAGRLPLTHRVLDGGHAMEIKNASCDLSCKMMSIAYHRHLGKVNTKNLDGCPKDKPHCSSDLPQWKAVLTQSTVNKNNLIKSSYP
jgi:hypothetical protein